MTRLAAAASLLVALLDAAATAQVPADSRPGSRPETRPIYVVTGRIVGKGRFPAAGIPVGAYLRCHEPVRSTTGPDGRFRLVLSGFDAQELPFVSMRAFGKDGRAAGSTLRKAEELRTGYGGATPVPGAEIDAGTLPLLPAARVEVRVVDGGEPVGWARVSLECHGFGDGSGFVEEVIADDRGVATFEGVVDNEVADAFEFRASARDGRTGFFWLHSLLEPETRVTIALATERVVVVRAVEAGTTKPIAGATVHLGTTRSSVWYSVPTCPPAKSTGPDGTVTIRRLCAGEDIRAAVSADGYETESELDLPREGVLTAALKPSVRHCTPISPKSPVRLAQGTELRVLLDERYYYANAPELRATVDQDSVCVRERLWSRSIAIAPDQSFCRLGAGVEEASFARSRTAGLTLRWDDGAPASGLRVRLHRIGDSIPEPVVSDHAVTDAKGQARLTAFCDQTAAARVEIDGQWVEVGGLDLSEGDAALDATVPRPLDVTLRVTFDGRRELPADLDVWYPIRAEDPEMATLSFRIPLHPGRERDSVMVSGAEFTTTTVALPDTKPGSRLVVDAPLHSGATVYVDATTAGPTHFVQLEQFEAKAGQWIERHYLHLPIGAGTRARSRLSRLEPGTYRFFENETGMRVRDTSLPFMIAEGEKSKTVTLDLTRRLRISGRVEAPPGTRLDDVFVVPVPPGRAESRPAPRSGIPVKSDGTFESHWVGAEFVRLEAWHPSLQPEAGIVEIGASTSTAILRLEPAANVATFSVDYDLPPEFAEHGEVRVLLFSGAPGAKPAAECTAVPGGSGLRFSQFEPGRYTVMIDPPSEVEYLIARAAFIRRLPSRAPLVLPNVTLGRGPTDLGRLAFARGSTLRVKFDAAWPAPLPAVILEAQALDAPAYERRLHSAGERELVLPGLRPGLFRVTVSRESIWEPGALLDREVFASDGVNDVTILVPPPR